MGARAGAGRFSALMALPLLASSCVMEPLSEETWPEHVDRGLVYAGWSPEGYRSEESAASLAALASTGASHVAVVVTGYVGSIDDSTVESLPSRTPSAESVRSALGRARAHGLRTVLKPHVDVLGGEYRGTLAPRDVALWFETYRAFLLPWAELADEQGCSSFWIGTELDSMTRHVGRWDELIEAVRERYSGPLVYAANWADIESPATIELGSRMDLVGVDAFFPVSEWPRPSVLDMVVAWQPWLGLIEDFERRTGRPVLVTELGCMSRQDGPVSPWQYDGGGPVDLRTQARYYEAALRALAGCPSVRGVYFWGWGLGPGGPSDGAHTPRGKPAEEVLRSFWGGTSPI